MMWLLGLLGPQGIAIAMAVSLLGSAAGGAYAMHRWDNASYYRAESKALEKKLRTIETARQKDAQSAMEASKRADKLQELIDEVTESVGNGECFNNSESNSLRRLWRR